MKKENNKGIIILLVVIIIILSVVCVLLATNTISFKNQEITNCIQDIQEINNEPNQNIVENNEESNKNKNFYNVSELNVKAFNEYGVFKDISKNGNVSESLHIGENYFVSLDLSGNVEVSGYIEENHITSNLNINNVIDIIDFFISGAEETEQILYLLTENGEVYFYKVGEINNRNFNVTKVDNVSNVVKLFISNYSKENAGGSWAIFAITENNDCIMLNGDSV